MHWTKDGSDPAQMRSDISACDGKARMRAQSDAFMSPRYVYEPAVRRDASGRASVTWAQRNFPDQSLREQSLFELCMKDKGYRYEPAEARP